MASKIKGGQEVKLKESISQEAKNKTVQRERTQWEAEERKKIAESTP